MRDVNVGVTLAFFLFLHFIIIRHVIEKGNHYQLTAHDAIPVLALGDTPPQDDPTVHIAVL